MSESDASSESHLQCIIGGNLAGEGLKHQEQNRKSDQQVV